ncbi:hypothetical protein LTR62_005115 [Meristemomyces frigidus]|uniref:Uncharacterized protein n=1 Tax=Meristemomyces frigidus TaxID=1508187 RepID=A0AAN7YN17_9PEZI|nr:hypothetical protein LTR62_005115 [Meristemomyces frigidus]
MPATSISSLDQHAIPRRIPKLAVRNRIPDSEVVSTKSSSTETVTDLSMRPTLSSHPSEQTIGPGSLARRPSNLSQLSGQHEVGSRGRNGSIASTTTGQKASKKKSSGMLSFFTLKEPSTSAWEEYAQAQKKAAASSKASRSTAQKLPDYVPATNSKWNGLPESAERMSKDTKRSSKRLSTLSSATRQTGRTITTSYSDNSNESSGRKYGSLSSKLSRPQSMPTQHSHNLSMHSRTSINTVQTHVNATHPAHRNNAVTPWDEPTEEERPESSQTFLHPPSPTPSYNPEGPLSSLPTPELEIPSLALAADGLVTPEHSPRTPPADFSANLIDAIALTSTQEARTSNDSDDRALATFWHSDTDTEPESLDSSSRPLSIAFSRLGRRPAGRHQPIFEEECECEGEEREGEGFAGRTRPFLETMPLNRPRGLEPEGRGTATTAGTTGIHGAEEEHKRGPSPKPSYSSETRTPSLTPSKAESEISFQWHQTPKQRLGLGGRLSRIAAEENLLPWEERMEVGTYRDREWEGVGSSVGLGMGNRSSIVSQATMVSEVGKFKRLSLRLGGRR